MCVRPTLRPGRLARVAAVAGLLAVAALLAAVPQSGAGAGGGACATTTTLTMPRSVVWGRAAQARVAVTSRCGVPKGLCSLTIGGGLLTQTLDSHGRCVFRRFLLDRLGPQRRRAIFKPAAGWRASRSAVKTVVVVRPSIPVVPALEILGFKLYPNGVRPGNAPLLPIGTPIEWCPGVLGYLTVVYSVRGRSDDGVAAHAALPDGTSEGFGPFHIGFGFGVAASTGAEWELGFQTSGAGTAHVDLHLRRAGVAADLAFAAADVAITCAAPPPV